MDKKEKQYFNEFKTDINEIDERSFINYTIEDLKEHLSWLKDFVNNF